MDLNKIAQDNQLTYLEKVAAIVDEFAAGNISGEDADAIASDNGIATQDLLAIHNAAYGDAEDLDKTAAAEDAAGTLIKIAEDESSTYLEKCAGLADAFAAGAISGEDADQLAMEIGLEPSDVASIFDAAYTDELGKEAGAKTDKVVDAVKKYFTHNINQGGEYGKRIVDDTGMTTPDMLDNYKKLKNYEYLKAAGKIGGAVAAPGAVGYGATKLFQNRNKKKR